MEEQAVKKEQTLHIEYRNGTTETHSDIKGYQIGGGVVAITFSNHSIAIVPLDTVQGILIFNKE